MNLRVLRARQLLDAIPPAGGAAVMGTGIIANGLALDGRKTLGQILLGVAAAIWLCLALVFAERVLRKRARWVAESRSPAALTAVAGTSVLGTGFAQFGVDPVAIGLLVLAAACLLALLPGVIRFWRRPTVGVSFVVTVAVESIAVLTARVALEEDWPWLAPVVVALLALGLAAYPVVLASFDLRQLVVGRGDHWVAGGALAIATLACALAAETAGLSPSLDGLRGALDDAAIALWIAAAAWLPVLLAVELVARRPAYHTARWATVFPVGMYAVCSFDVGGVDSVRAVTEFAHVWIWVALAVWAAVALGAVRRGLALARRSAPTRTEDAAAG